jgi:hypothetical protein
MNSVIRLEDSIYVIRRVLSNTTSEEAATIIHNSLGTDSLLRDKDGKWFCCMKAKDAEYRDIELIPTESRETYEGTQFELGDTGGIG